MAERGDNPLPTFKNNIGVCVSKKKDWKGTEPVAKTAEQHKRDAEYEAMSPEEKKVVHRKQFVSWLEMFQGTGPILHINGKAQEARPSGLDA